MSNQDLKQFSKSDLLGFAAYEIFEKTSVNTSVNTSLNTPVNTSVNTPVNTSVNAPVPKTPAPTAAPEEYEPTKGGRRPEAAAPILLELVFGLVF